jgi:hypothetical protein
VEVYDAKPQDAASRHMMALAFRAQVGTGAKVLIPGFVISGTQFKTSIIRGVGPTMKSTLPAAVSDPKITLYSGSTVIATNDDYESSPDIPELLFHTNRIGLSPLLAGSKDAAMLVRLAPGAYTVKLEGSADAPEGLALIELYEAE